MILHLLNTQVSICCNTVYEICMALKADSVAYEYECSHQQDMYEYVHHGIPAKRAHVTKWETSNNMVKYIEINTVLSSGKGFHAREGVTEHCHIFRHHTNGNAIQVNFTVSTCSVLHHCILSILWTYSTGFLGNPQSFPPPSLSELTDFSHLMSSPWLTLCMFASDIHIKNNTTLIKTHTHTHTSCVYSSVIICPITGCFLNVMMLWTGINLKQRMSRDHTIIAAIMHVFCNS
jgi:hypothetical protein